MNTPKIRVSIIGPQYRASILGHSYEMAFDEENNECCIAVDSENETYTFNANYEVAGQYRIEVYPVDIEAIPDTFLLSAVYPHESAT